MLGQQLQGQIIPYLRQPVAPRPGQNNRNKQLRHNQYRFARHTNLPCPPTRDTLGHLILRNDGQNIRLAEIWDTMTTSPLHEAVYGKI